MATIPTTEQSNNRIAKWLAYEDLDKYPIYLPQVMQFINFGKLT